LVVAVLISWPCLEPVSAGRSRSIVDDPEIKDHAPSFYHSDIEIMPLDDEEKSDMITITSNDHVKFQVEREMIKQSELFATLIDHDKESCQFTLPELNGKQIQWVSRLYIVKCSLGDELSKESRNGCE
jgi:hypothetical protein